MRRISIGGLFAVACLIRPDRPSATRPSQALNIPPSSPPSPSPRLRLRFHSPSPSLLPSEHCPRRRAEGAHAQGRILGYRGSCQGRFRQEGVPRDDYPPDFSAHGHAISALSRTVRAPGEGPPRHSAFPVPTPFVYFPANSPLPPPPLVPALCQPPRPGPHAISFPPGLCQQHVSHSRSPSRAPHPHLPARSRLGTHP